MTVSETTKSAGGQDEQDALALLAADEHLADAQRDGPRGRRRTAWAASSGSRGRTMPSAWSAWSRDDDQQHEERAADEEPARALPRCP